MTILKFSLLQYWALDFLFVIFYADVYVQVYFDFDNHVWNLECASVRCVKLSCKVIIFLP